MKIKLKNPDSFKTTLIVKGFSQRGFARELGVSEPYGNQIANGTRNPGPEIAKKITTLLEGDFEDFFYILHDDKSNQSTA